MPTEERYFKDGAFISTYLPEMSLGLPEAFAYIGQTNFVLNQIARVDRHHFLDAATNGSIRRIVILHFESFLPHVNQTFNYSIPDPSNRSWPDGRYSPAKVRIGTAEYIHNTWFFDAKAHIQENPQGELARTAQLFREQGFTLPDELQMSRYVRVVDAKRKSELILFYLEPLKETGYKAADFVEGGRGEAVFDHLSAKLTVRSDKVFKQA